MKIALFLPELFLLCSCLVLFLLSLGRPGARQVWGITTILASLVAAIIVVLNVYLLYRTFVTG